MNSADIIMGLNDDLLWEVHMDHETLLNKLKTTPRPFTMKIGRTISSDSQCVQHAGEVLFVPSHWHHATLNYGVNVGLANTVG